MKTPSEYKLAMAVFIAVVPTACKDAAVSLAPGFSRKLNKQLTKL